MRSIRYVGEGLCLESVGKARSPAPLRDSSNVCRTFLFDARGARRAVPLTSAARIERSRITFRYWASRIGAVESKRSLASNLRLSVKLVAERPAEASSVRMWQAVDATHEETIVPRCSWTARSDSKISDFRQSTARMSANAGGA